MEIGRVLPPGVTACARRDATNAEFASAHMLGCE
jgi:hypothetical protein